jgi:hypothetical protein
LFITTFIYLQEKGIAVLTTVVLPRHCKTSKRAAKEQHRRRLGAHQWVVTTPAFSPVMM